MLQTILSDGIFKQSQQVGMGYLLELDVDRLLKPYYESAGIESTAERYGGWETKEIGGHSLGHFLSAASVMVFYTQNQELEEKIQKVLDGLNRCQQMAVDGYIGGVNRAVFDRVFNGEFTVERFALDGVWVPWYNIHKIYAGLLDCYTYLKKELALNILEKLADWSVKGTKSMSDEAFKKMLTCEYGGMNEVLFNLYKVTKNESYLQLGKRFNDEALFKPLMLKNDALEGLHANTQLPKIHGAIAMYQSTGEKEYYDLAEYFFWQVVQHRSYAMGGNSFSEHFVKCDHEPLGVATTETCNTYNMCRLAGYLHDIEKNGRFMDYYEHALLNHILASQDPDTGMKTYFVPTAPGHMKTYCTPDDSFWCCTGTGMENPGRYNDYIYSVGLTGENVPVLFVNLFIASSIQEARTGLTIAQHTEYPEKNMIRISVLKSSGMHNAIAVRIPEYSGSRTKIRVNAYDIELLSDGSGLKVVHNESLAKMLPSIHMEYNKGYLYFYGTFNEGDAIEMTLDMPLWTYNSKEGEDSIVFFKGPVMLAAALGRENYPDKDNIADHTSLFFHPKVTAPVIVSDASDLTALLDPSEEKPLEFVLPDIGMPGNQDLHFKPFYQLHHERYAMYLRKMSQEAYEHAPLNEAYQDHLEKMTLDQIVPNQQQSELDHQLSGENMVASYDQEAGYGFREAKRGYIGYTFKPMVCEEPYLCVSYWGDDTEVWAPDGVFPRRFSIFANEEKIAETELRGKEGNRLFDVYYPLESSALEQGLVLRFACDENTMTGRIFGIRITKGRL